MIGASKFVYVERRIGCSPILNSKQILQAENRRTYNVARIPASEFSMNLAAFNVYRGSRVNGQTWNQSSDRAVEHGNSESGSSTEIAHEEVLQDYVQVQCDLVGKVDIKHNSYARYLNRIKGGAMAQGPYVGNRVGAGAVVNNKVQKQNSVNCGCNQ